MKFRTINNNKRFANYLERSAIFKKTQTSHVMCAIVRRRTIMRRLNRTVNTVRATIAAR